MFSCQNGIVKTSVRRLVEFLLREGDITSSTSFKIDTEAMLAGSRIHKKIQGKQGATYRAEVLLKMTWEEENYRLVLEGRADGIDRKNQLFYIDEIKGVYRDVTKIEQADLLHLAQAKCYAYMYAFENQLSEIGVQITYCNLDTEEIKTLWHQYTMEELTEWFEDLLDSCKLWANHMVKHLEDRNQSIRKLSFPFDYREGQKTLSAIVFQSIQKGEKVFLQAPTGVGKTIATLYPAIKAMGKGQTERIFYLTAKTITRTVAEDTMRLLASQNLALQSVTITAKEKICSNQIFECNPASCPMAKGHFNRINEALYDMIETENLIDRSIVLAYADKYQVCPYELSFEAANWSDMMICDYNYVFDPMVHRQHMTQEAITQTFLIDEAHNLLERAREMYSAQISTDQFKSLKEHLGGKAPHIVKRAYSCKKILYKWQKDLVGLRGAKESVDDLYFPLLRLCNELSEYLSDHPDLDMMKEILQLYFSWKYFLQVMEYLDEGFQIYEEIIGEGLQVKLFCVDPSTQLQEYIRKGNSAIFFSATLLPIHYYKKLLCSEDAKAFSIPSPFDTEYCLRMIANDVTSRYRLRGLSEYKKIIAYLEKTVEIKKGNYMIFFPSYEMLQNVYEQALGSTLTMIADLLPQHPDMSEEEREEFLQAFQAERDRPLIALCVLGSLYSEGIDLTGERLIGVFIVGTGLPGLSFERKMIMEYFDRKKENGYDYAYRYPGINKVLQAAGRVIRTVSDKGIIVLMDDRFLWKENLKLLSQNWNSYYETNYSTYEQIVKAFWEDHDSL